MKRIIYQDEEPKNWRKIKFFITLFVVLLAFTMIGFLAYLCFKTTEVPIAQASEPKQIDYCGLDAVICEDEYLPPIKVETPYKSKSSPTEANKGIYQVTAYVWTGNKMANGEYPHIGACASNDFPFGTKIELVDLGINCVVKDTGGMGSGVIDVFMGSRDEAIKFGRKYSTIKIN